MKRLYIIMSLMLCVSMMFAQGIDFEPEGTTLVAAAAKAKKENKED